MFDGQQPELLPHGAADAAMLSQLEGNAKRRIATLPAAPWLQGSMFCM